MTKRSIALALAVLGVLCATPAQAVQTCQTRKDIRQRDDPYAPFAIGDSVMLAAADQLAEHGFAVDAQACRMYNQGLEIMNGRELPDTVVIALGSNADVSAAQVRSTLELVGPFGRVVFVLPRKLGGGPDPDGRVFRAAEQAYPEQVSTLDWPDYSAGHSDWLASDGLHLTSAGAQAFADFIAGATEFAAPADELQVPQEPLPREPKPKPPPAPKDDPFVTALWSAFSETADTVVRPAVRLLRQLVRPGNAGPEDL